MTYTTTFTLDKESDNVSLHFPEWKGTALGVSINGGKEKLLAWLPYELEIGSELCQGDSNILSIKVYGHRRNAMGPFFCKEKWPNWSGPPQFREYDSPERQLVPCGLLRPPEIIIKK